MKAALRKNGMMLVDMRVDMTISAGHIAAAIANELDASDSWEPDEGYSRTAIMKIVREQLAEHGQSIIYHTHEDWCTKDAWELTRQFFPEMCGQPFETQKHHRHRRRRGSHDHQM
jgi:hypothetical protein